MKAKYGTVSVSESYISSEDESTSSVDNERNADPSSSGIGPTETHRNTSVVTPQFKWFVLSLLGLIIFSVEGGNALVAAPRVALYQGKLCDSLSVSLGVDVTSDACGKNPEVQRKLALLQGTSNFLESVPIFLLSTVYGSLADRYGRRSIMFLALLGMALNSLWTISAAWISPKISIHWIWGGPAFLTIGGGSGVAVALLFTCAADVVSTEFKANAFALLYATSLSSIMCAAVISSLMMMRMGNTAPILLGLALQFGGLVIIFFLPDTKPVLMSRLATETQEDDSHESSTSPLLNRGNTAPTKKKGPVWKSILDCLKYLWQTHGVFPVFIASFFMLIGNPTGVLTTQYMPYRFGISLAEANLYNGVYSGVSLVVLLICIPSIGALLLRRNRSAFQKDMALATVSCALSLVGAATMAMAPNLAICAIGLVMFALGVGLASLLRSLIIDLFPPEDAAFSTSLISLVKAMALSLSTPVVSAVYAWSLNYDNIFRGLPFFFTTIGFVIAQICLVLVRTPARLHNKVVD